MDKARRFRKFDMLVGLPDSKRVQAFRLLRGHLDLLDARPGRALVAPGHHLIHHILRPLEYRFDPPVGAVPYPPGDAEPAGMFRGGLPKEHALNHSRDDRPDPDHDARG